MVLPPQNRLCNEVCLEASQYPNSNELYLNSSELLKTELNNDINLCLVDFCERHNIGYRGMVNRLITNNMYFFYIWGKYALSKA